MPIDLSSLVADHAVTTVTFGGSTAKIVYKPSYVTQESIEKLDSEEDGNIQFLVNAIISWDIMAGPKKKVPLTVDAIKKLPLSLVRSVTLSILGGKDDSEGSGEVGNGSFGG